LALFWVKYSLNFYLSYKLFLYNLKIVLGLAAFVVLPLGLLRDVNSLNTICTAAIIFYACLVFKVYIFKFK